MAFKSSIEKLELSRLSIAPTTSCSESKIRNILFCDKAKWDVVPTKISMDEILSVDVTPQNLSEDKPKGGKG